ncbi:ribonuclease III [Amaricoccus macauensis]|uniref:ribonuclease III n=1 Tax=Amaricoccus macauensis TaxID=57001 RepID=UPI003C7DF2F4
MKLSRALSDAAKRLGHGFTDPALLIEALTHPSMSTRPNNQRLEFLGDRVLGLVISEELLAQDQDADEGKLAPRLNALVRKETCAEVATEIGLGEVLRMGRSEMLSGGRRKMAILGDAMEAVIAAVYLDGGLEAARSCILAHWADRIAKAKDAQTVDAKTTLQEWAQARGQQPPVYVDLERSGPDHAPIFTVEVRLKNGESARGRAASKRGAQQQAAEALLMRLEEQS